jgi:hypothetical protein
VCDLEVMDTPSIQTPFVMNQESESIYCRIQIQGIDTFETAPVTVFIVKIKVGLLIEKESDTDKTYVSYTLGSSGNWNT